MEVDQSTVYKFEITLANRSYPDRSVVASLCSIDTQISFIRLHQSPTHRRRPKRLYNSHAIIAQAIVGGLFLAR